MLTSMTIWSSRHRDCFSVESEGLWGTSSDLGKMDEGGHQAKGFVNCLPKRIVVQRRSRGISVVSSSHSSEGRDPTIE